MAKEIVYKEFSYKLNGIFYYVHNKLGRYCSHKQYMDAIEIIFKEKKIQYEREVEMPIEFVGNPIKGNRIDFLVEKLIPLDIKTGKYIAKADFIQMIRYLKAINKKLGIIVNFHQRSLKPKRVINPNYDHSIRI